MPHMYFMSSFNSPLSAPRSTSISVTNQAVSIPVATQPVNQTSNLRDMFHAIRTGSNSCKSCGRG